MTIEAQAAFITEVQRLCREARENRSKSALDRAALLVDGPQFRALPDDAQEDLSEAYARALLFVTGAMAP